MKKINSIAVDKSICETLEMYDYEYKCKSDIISNLIKQGIDINEPSFIAYQKDAVDVLRKFELTKQLVYDTFVAQVNNAVNWELEYSTGKLTITIEE